MHGLDRLLSKPSQLAALRTLYHADEPLTGREVERRTGLSNRAAMLALESLTDLAAVHCEQTPQAHWYELNRSHYLVAKGLRLCFDAEDQFWEDLRKTVRRVVVPRPLAAVVTGALARDDSDVEGRLDITMVFTNSRTRIRAFRGMDALEEAIWNRYALEMTYNLLLAAEVDEDEYDLLWRRVEREGVLLFGKLP